MIQPRRFARCYRASDIDAARGYDGVGASDIDYRRQLALLSALHYDIAGDEAAAMSRRRDITQIRHMSEECCC